MTPKRVLSHKHKAKQTIRKTLPPLRAEEHSAFTHGIWHRYDLIRLMQWSAKVLDQHHDQTGKYDYSAVQDAFYALNGLTPNESPAGKAWRSVQQAPGFEDLREMMNDQFGQAAAVSEVASNFEKYMMQPPDEQQAEEEKKEEEERQQAAQPQPTPQPEEKDDQDKEPEGDTEDNSGEDDREYSQEEGQEDPSDASEGGEDESDPQDGNDASGEGSGGQPSGQPSGQPTGQGSDGADDIVPADSLAGLGVIKKAGQRGNARQVVNPQVVEEAQQEAQTVSTVYSFLHDATPDREARANELVDLNLLDMKSLVNFLGWMRRVVKGARRRGKRAVGEFTGYRPGSWGSNTHPMEMAEVAAGNPIYLTRMVENQLTNRNFREDRPLGKGPVIVLRDESDSMDSDNMVIDGKTCTLHQAALSFEVALASIMNKEKRDLIGIAWSAGGTRQHTYGEKGVDEHWGAFIGGGTRIEPALEEALKVAKDYVKGADMLIITDGDLQMDPRSPQRTWEQSNVEMLQEYRERGGRVWAIVINPRVQDVAHKLAWVDGWVTVNDMRAGEKVADMLEKMSADRMPAKGKGRVRV